MMKNFRKYAIGLLTATSAVGMTTMSAWAAEKQEAAVIQKASVAVEIASAKQTDIAIDGVAGMETQAATMIAATYTKDGEFGLGDSQFKVMMQKDGKYALIDQKTGEVIDITLKAADEKDLLNTVVITEVKQGMMKK